MSSVIVVGAGLAGLNCAQILSKSGFEVTVLEASERIGGRVKSDYIDGFTCDHGFQVINPKYSELQRTGVVTQIARGLRSTKLPTFAQTPESFSS